MSKSIPQPSTPRRSTRHQPTATPSVKLNDKNILECSWASEPIYTRPMHMELDIIPEQRAEYEDALENSRKPEPEGDSGGSEDELTPEVQFETTFYDAFRMKRKATAFRGTKRLQVGKTETQTYRVGDAVMVETDTLLSIRRPPSIGVIVSMWETHKVGQKRSVGLEGRSASASDAANIRIRVHWFVRPSEMASVRAKRDHEDNEIYYCLLSKSILTPSVILSRCTVTRRKLADIDFSAGEQDLVSGRGWVLSTPSKSNTKGKTPSKSRTKSTPLPPSPTPKSRSKPTPGATGRGKGKAALPGSPLKKSTRFNSPSPSPPGSSSSEDEDEEEDHEREHGEADDALPSGPDHTFYCTLAVDSMRGVFFEFDWDTHRRAALARTKPPPQRDGGGMDISLDHAGNGNGNGNGDRGIDGNAVADPSTLSDSHNPAGKAVKPWGEGEEWNLVEVKLKPKGSGKGTGAAPAAVKGANGKGKPGKGKARAEWGGDRQDDVAMGSESESEGGDDSDEYAGSGDEYTDDDLLEDFDDEDEDDDGEMDEDGDDDDMDPLNPHTPRKRKRGSTWAGTRANPTPHSRAILARRRRQRERRGEGGGEGGAHGGDESPRKKQRTWALRLPASASAALTFQASMAHLPPDPYLRAMHALHVGSRPDVLPCREGEYADVLSKVGDLLQEGSGGCVYISGVPGTGKTATVHAVVKELKRMAESGEVNPFTYVEINGLKIPEPAAAYNLLWEGIQGHDVAKDGHLRLSTKESLKALMRHFTTGNRGPGGHACVVLMDELDQLVTPKQDVVYNFFNWPTLVGSKLVVIAVANTMDLPERAMTGRVRSRMGMSRINFASYKREQLEKIVYARLESAQASLEGEADGELSKQVVVAPDAVKLASMKVAGITGDARRVLDVLRRAVEEVRPRNGKVKATDVLDVMTVMQNTPTAAYLADLSHQERVLLCSLIKCIKRQGVEEIKWGDVVYLHHAYLPILADGDNPKRKVTDAELGMVLDSLVASRAVILEDGPAVRRKAESERRMLLNIEQGEVEKVLIDIGGKMWKNLIGN